MTILLIEDEPEECQEIAEYIETRTDVQLVGVTNNTQKALELTVDLQPDVIILDLELHKGYGDGLSFLDSLREMNLGFPIYILITTNTISRITHEGARKMGADFIMIKSQEDYSAKRVIDFLCSLKSIIHGSKKTVSHSSHGDKAKSGQHKLNRIIMELDLIGIAPNMLGRKYLMECINLLLDGQSENLTKTVAVKNKKSVGSVERAMQHAIERAWKLSCIEDLRKYYTARIHSARGIPTMTEFIYYYAEKIKNER